VTKEKRLR